MPNASAVVRTAWRKMRAEWWLRYHAAFLVRGVLGDGDKRDDHEEVMSLEYIIPFSP